MKISLCMMVKNEEAFLTQCLESVKDFVDEIIIVDTGSTDKTMEIAKEYGAKIHEHPWESNFSLHRNQSLSYATGDWCFILDADEQVVSGWDDTKKLLKALPKSFNAASLQLHDMKGDDVAMKHNTPRFFRRGQVRYKGIVHNQPIIKGKSAMMPMIIRHYGYDLTPEKQQVKHDRTRALLKKRLEKNPKDYEAIFYLAQLELCKVEPDKESVKTGLEYSKRYMNNRKNVKGPFNNSIYFTGFQAAMVLDDLKTAEKFLRKGTNVIPDDIDLAWGVVRLGVVKKDPCMIVAGTAKYVAIFEELKNKPHLTGTQFIYKNNYESLCFCLYHCAFMECQSGISTLKHLFSALEKTEPGFRVSLGKDILREFGKIGINVTKKEGEKNV